MPNLDLNLLPLVRRAGEEQAALPGLYAVTAPRRAARGRGPDRLILYLALTGNAPLSLDQHNQLLNRLAQTYYQTPGSVTAAIRVIVDSLNKTLLERNLRSTANARQGVGLLIVAVEREGHLYLAHCGPMHTFVVSAQGAQHFHDPDSAGRGLGLGRSAPIRYFQADLQSRDVLLFTPQPPAGWDIPALQNTYGQGLESLRRKLLGLAGPDLASVLIQSLEGSGKMRLLWPKATAAEGSEESEAGGQRSAASEPLPAISDQTPMLGNQAPAPGEPTPAVVGIEDASVDLQPAPAAETPPMVETQPVAAPPNMEELSSIEQPLPVAESAPDVLESPHLSQAPDVQPTHPSGRLVDQKSPALPRRERPARRQPGQSLAALGARLAPVGQGLGRAILRVLGALRLLFKRILPDETLLNLSPMTMLLIAVAVAVILGTAGAVMYYNRGRSQQYQVYYDQAVILAAQAQAQTDPVQQHAAWELALNEVQKAETYRKTDESKALLAIAQTEMDRLDSVQRLVFQPAMRNFIRTVNFTRMQASTMELYLLDSSQGVVARTFISNAGYLGDPQFRCGPGSYGLQFIGPLIDFTILPEGSEFNATVLGMDAKANLVYCIPNDTPKAIALATPTETGWGTPAAFAYDAGNLFVLDTQLKKIWVYQGMKISEQPFSFFDETVEQVPNLQDVVDLTANRNDVYLLHADGRLTQCTLGRVEGILTRCQDPAIFVDNRPGRQPADRLADATFSQLLYSPPPDPSLYFFDAENQAIYQFGLQMTLYKQYRAALPESGEGLPNGPATAFTVSPDRRIFMAFGYRVYYTLLP